MIDAIKTFPTRYWIIVGVLAGTLILLFLMEPGLGWLALILLYPGLIAWVFLSYRRSTHFLSQLASLLTAGYPLPEALGLLRSYQPVFAKRLDRVISDLENGSGFAESCRRRIHSFPKVLVRLLEEGEKQGELPRFIKAWIEYHRTQYTSLKDINNVLGYVFVVFIVCLLVVAVLLVFVVPVFQAMFADFGKSLPVMTQITIASAGIIKSVFIWVLLLAVAAYIAYKAVRHKGPLFSWQRKFDTLLLIKLIQTAILKGGDLADAVTSAARVPQYPGYAPAAKALVAGIRNGDSWTGALEKRPDLPPDLVAALASGASAGNFGESLDLFYSAYRQLYSHQMLLWTGRLAVALVLFNGIVFGFITISMYLPIFMMGGVAW